MKRKEMENGDVEGEIRERSKRETEKRRGREERI